MTHPKSRSRRRCAAWVATLLALATTATVGLQVAPTFATLTDAQVVDANTVSTDTLAAPSGVTATLSGDNLVLNWTATPSTYATGYAIYHSPDPGGSYTQVGTVTGRTTTTWTHTTPPRGPAYYVIRAVIQNWDSDNTVESAASVPLRAPTTSGAGSNTTVSLSWTPVTRAAKYRVYINRCYPNQPVTASVKCDQFGYVFHAETTTTSLTLNENRQNTEYMFLVRAVDARGVEGLEEQAGKTNIRTIPTWPDATTTAASIIATFDEFLGDPYEAFEVKTVQSYARSFKAQRKVGATGNWVDFDQNLEADLNTADLWRANSGRVPGWTLPTSGVEYYYRVQGCNESGCSPWIESATPSRVPWKFVRRFFAPDYKSVFTVNQRMSQTAIGPTNDFTLVTINGPSNLYSFGVCPPFRTCSGTDKAMTLTDPTSSGSASATQLATKSGCLHRSGNDSTARNPAGTSARTISFWYRQSAGFEGNAWMFGAVHSSGDGSGFVMRTGANRNVLQVGQGATGAFAVTNARFNDEQWHLYHVVVGARSAGSNPVSVYEDGVLLRTSNVAVDTGTGATDLTLGCAERPANITAANWPGGSGGTYQGAAGSYDELAIYHRALTAAEITAQWDARADGD